MECRVLSCKKPHLAWDFIPESELESPKLPSDWIFAMRSISLDLFWQKNGVSLEATLFAVMQICIWLLLLPDIGLICIRIPEN